MQGGYVIGALAVSTASEIAETNFVNLKESNHELRPGV
jgi:hypothetical protein